MTSGSTDVVNTSGFAGQIGLSMALGDLATVRIATTRRDPYFRQLGRGTVVPDEQRPGARHDRPARPVPAATSRVWRSHSRSPTRTPLSTRRSSRSRTWPATRSRGFDRRGHRPRATRCPSDGYSRSPAPGTRRSSTTSASPAPIYALGNRSEFQDGLTTPVHAFRRLLRDAAGRGLGPGWRRRWRAWSSRTHAAVAVHRRSGTGRVQPATHVVPPHERPGARLRAARVVPQARGRRGRYRAGWRRGRAICGGTHRSLELQPLPHLTARADVVILRDLRDYDPMTPNGAAAADRPRSRSSGWTPASSASGSSASSVTYAPEIAGLAASSRGPRVELLVAARSECSAAVRVIRCHRRLRSAEPPRLAVRLGNTRTITVGAGIDVAKAGTKYAGPASLAGRIAQYLQPIDVSIDAGDPELLRRRVRRARYRVSTRHRFDHRIPRAQRRRREQCRGQRAAVALEWAQPAARPRDHESHAADDDAQLGATARGGADQHRR